MAKIINRFTNRLICEESLLNLKKTAEKHKKDLWGADLVGANLRGARLVGADLTKANLRGADLEAADLTGAIIFTKTIKNFKAIEFLKNLCKKY